LAFIGAALKKMLIRKLFKIPGFFLETIKILNPY